MIRNRFFRFNLLLCILFLVGTACSLTGKAPQPTPTAESVGTPTPENTATAAPPVLLRQWASSAISNYSIDEENYAPSQATGAPDTAECLPEFTSWWTIPDEYDPQAWLHVTFSHPVKPAELNVYLSYQPSSVVEIYLIDVTGSEHTIYTAEKETQETCPYVLSVQVEDADYEAYAATILLSKDMDEPYLTTAIDAVELVGAPLAYPAPTPSPTPVFTVSSLGISPAHIPEGFFHFELYDSASGFSYVTENDGIEWYMSEPHQSFSLLGRDLQASILLKLPVDIEPINYGMNTFHMVNPLLPTAGLYIEGRFYPGHEGYFWFDRVSADSLTGVLEFNAIDENDPAVFISAVVIFNKIPLDYQNEPGPGEFIRQWASSGSASSEQTTVGEALGPVNTYDECDRAQTAWIPKATSGQQWLEVYFDRPVQPVHINILMTALPGAVTEVLLLTDTDSLPVNLENMEYVDGCPAGLMITILEEMPLRVIGLHIVLEYAESGVRPGIDAVELVGIPQD